MRIDSSADSKLEHFGEIGIHFRLTCSSDSRFEPLRETQGCNLFH